MRWRQEHQNELWIGHRDGPNQVLQKDPSLLDAETRGYAHLPGGHQEAWADAFCNLMRDIYGFIAAGKSPKDAHPPSFATFDDGYRANCVVEAILKSAKAGAWTKVDY
jgi:predicted dehydrogenase